MKTIEDMEKALEHIEFVKKMEKKFRARIEFEIRMGAYSSRYKIIEASTQRRLKNGAEAFLNTLGLPESKLYKKSLVGIPALEKLIKGEDREILNNFIERPKGSEKLVEMSAKGKPISFDDIGFENLDEGKA